MIPRVLEIEGFLSYGRPVRVDFTGVRLVCISGPNGAGKSSLLDAITWALFGEARRRDEGVIHLGADAARVSLEFAYEGAVYRVRRVKARGKSMLLEFAVQREDGSWKPLTAPTLRETQARIVEILRMDYRTFVYASFFLQGQADNFAQLRPGERKEVLAQMLGLERWEAYRQRAAERRREVETQLAHLQGRLAEMDEEIAQEPTWQQEARRLEAALRDVEAQRKTQEALLLEAQKRQAALAEQERLVAQLEQQWRALAAETQELETRLAQQEQALRETEALLAQAEEIRQQAQRWQEVREALDALDAQAAQFHQHREALAEQQRLLAQHRARLEQERQALQAQAAEAEAARQRLAALAAEQETLEAQRREVEARRQQRLALEQERQTLQERLTQARERFAAVRQQGVERRQRRDQLQSLPEEVTTCPLCGQPLSAAHRAEVLAALERELEELRQAYQQAQQEQEALQQQLAALTRDLQALDDVEAELRRLEAQAERLAVQREQAEALWQRWAAEGQPRLEEVTRRLEAEDFAPEVRERMRALEAELQALGYDPRQHEALRAEEQALRPVAERLRELEQAEARREVLKQALADLRRDLAARRAQAAQAEQAYREAVSRLQQARADLPDLDALEAQVVALKEQENRLRNEIAAVRQHLATIARLKEERGRRQAEQEALARRIERYKVLEQALSKDGVPALLIEQALPHLEAEANALLDRLTDGALQVRFITQRPYKDRRRRDLRETLELRIRDAQGERPYELFSGGEAFRINFAVRLALARLLAHRVGARLQTLVIDEGFGSQDALGRQRLIEALHAIAQDFEKILVITHLEELKDAFPHRLEVTKTPQGSQVTPIAQ